MSDVTEQYLREIEERCKSVLSVWKHERESCSGRYFPNRAIGAAYTMAEILRDLPRIIGALREARRKYEIASSWSKTFAKTAEELDIQMDKVQARIAELEEDGKMLDWLQEHWTDLESHYARTEEMERLWVPVMIRDPDEYTCLRDAIRAAMVLEPRGGSE